MGVHEGEQFPLVELDDAVALLEARVLPEDRVNVCFFEEADGDDVEAEGLGVHGLGERDVDAVVDGDDAEWTAVVDLMAMVTAVEKCAR